MKRMIYGAGGAVNQHTHVRMDLNQQCFVHGLYRPIVMYHASVKREKEDQHAPLKLCQDVHQTRIRYVKGTNGGALTNNNSIKIKDDRLLRVESGIHLRWI